MRLQRFIDLQNFLQRRIDNAQRKRYVKRMGPAPASLMSPPHAHASLTAEQRARIEKNKQEAQKRLQENLKKEKEKEKQREETKKQLKFIQGSAGSGSGKWDGTRNKQTHTRSSHSIIAMFSCFFLFTVIAEYNADTESEEEVQEDSLTQPDNGTAQMMSVLFLCCIFFRVFLCDSALTTCDLTLIFCSHSMSLLSMAHSLRRCAWCHF